MAAPSEEPSVFNKEKFSELQNMAQRRTYASNQEAKGLFDKAVCPACDIKLHIRFIGTDTLFVCPRCSWTKRVKGDVPGSMAPGEKFTGQSRHKGKTVLIYGPDGKPRSVE